MMNEIKRIAAIIGDKQAADLLYKVREAVEEAVVNLTVSGRAVCDVVVRVRGRYTVSFEDIEICEHSPLAVNTDDEHIIVEAEEAQVSDVRDSDIEDIVHDVVQEIIEGDSDILHGGDFDVDDIDIEDVEIDYIELEDESEEARDRWNAMARATRERASRKLAEEVVAKASDFGY